jgi:uncharacterized protein
MRLALDSDSRINLVRRYGGGQILIGEQLINRPCIVSPERLLLDWQAGSFAELSAAQLEPLFAFGAEIILIGSGDTQPYPDAQLRSLLRGRGAGAALEYMSLGAACRTYNILASEQRVVVAGLFP